MKTFLLTALLCAGAKAAADPPPWAVTVSGQSRVYQALLSQEDPVYGQGMDVDLSWQMLNAGLGLRSAAGETWPVAMAGLGLWDLVQIQGGISPYGALASLDVNLRVGHFLSGVRRHRGWGAWGIKAGAEVHSDGSSRGNGYVGLSWSWFSRPSVSQ